MNFIESTRGSISGGTDTRLVSFFEEDRKLSCRIEACNMSMRLSLPTSPEFRFIFFSGDVLVYHWQEAQPDTVGWCPGPSRNFHMTQMRV